MQGAQGFRVATAMLLAAFAVALGLALAGLAAGALGGFSAVTLGAVFRNHELRHGLPGLEFVAGERPSSRP